MRSSARGTPARPADRGGAAPAPGVAHERGGFALAMVVLLLFTVAVAGATGYQLVRVESELAGGVEAQEEALAVARAGLERFVGEHIGHPADTTTYLLGDGTVAVTKRKVAELDSVTHLYLLEAVGEVADARYPDSPAQRIVRQYAKLHTMPVRAKAALITVANNVSVGGSAEVLGTNDIEDTLCNDLGNTHVNGIAARSTGGGGGGLVNGSPAARVALGGITQVLDTAAVRWSVLQDAQFGVGTLDGTALPGSGVFAAMPDSFPVVRVNGNLTVGNVSFVSGRGVLIVTGTLSVSGFFANFNWDGIVLAGATAATLPSGFGSTMNIDGMLVAGLDGAAQTTLTLGNASLENCWYNIEMANRSLAYFELVDGARWEF